MSTYSARAQAYDRGSGCEQRNDIEFSRLDGQSLRMDASIPLGVAKAPAAILVHGGGWVAGSRRDMSPLFKPLEEGGFAWFSIDYRLATSAIQFGTAIDDVDSALRFIQSHAREFHVDPDRIVLVGESAGGQLAAMAALRKSSGVPVKAVVAFYTPTDLVSLVKSSDYVPAQIRNAVQGTPWESLIMTGLARLSPINNVSRNMPPFLFIHGTDDALVPFEQSTEMCNRMRTAGASCDVYPIAGAGHGLRWWEYSSRVSKDYKTEMISWLRRKLS